MTVLNALASEVPTGLDPNSISPGLIGFLATFGVVVVSILLFLNMNRRLRRMRYREEREAQEREGQERGGRDDGGSGQASGPDRSDGGGSSAGGRGT